jgi:hypothetical protein
LRGKIKKENEENERHEKKEEESKMINEQSKDGNSVPAQ